MKNSRIVVIGASDTGISFIEALLSISYLNFTNIVLIAPGGLPHHHFDDDAMNLKAYSTSYTNEELKRLMMETRVRVINARMVDIDRGDKNVILHDETVVPYDTLILAMGLQDQTLNSLGYISRGIAPVQEQSKRVEGLISIDDPYLYQHLRKGGTLMNMLTNKKRPQKVIVYGRALHTYVFVQGLIARGVKPENIRLVIPDKFCHVENNYDEEEEMLKDLPIINPDAFEDEYIEEKVQAMLEAKGVQIYRHMVIMSITESEDATPHNDLWILFKRLDIPDEEEEEEDELEGIEGAGEGGSQKEGAEGSMNGAEGIEGELEEGEENVVPKKKRKKNEVELECKVLVTAGHRDVDPDVFNAIHNNGLVYNGRLIVDKNF